MLDLDDVAEFDQDLAEAVRGNTRRYVSVGIAALSSNLMNLSRVSNPPKNYFNALFYYYLFFPNSANPLPPRLSPTSIPRLS